MGAKTKGDQLPGAPSRAAPILLAGTLSIDVFMLFLIPSALQVMAAIHVRFPTSRIIKRLHAVHNHEARQFFGQWSDVLRTAEDEYSGDIHLSTW
jgi:hypothetical protein